jgi:hypothetical protein
MTLYLVQVLGTFACEFAGWKVLKTHLKEQNSSLLTTVVRRNEVVIYK